MHKHRFQMDGEYAKTVRRGEIPDQFEFLAEKPLVVDDPFGRPIALELNRLAVRHFQRCARNKLSAKGDVLRGILRAEEDRNQERAQQASPDHPLHHSAILASGKLTDEPEAAKLGRAVQDQSR